MQERILLIKTHAIGDLILVTPAFRALRRQYPDAKISLLVGKWSGSLMTSHPALDEVIMFDDAVLHKRNLPGIITLIRRLRKKRFDSVYIFHQSTAIFLFALFTGIRKRVGFASGAGRFLLTHSVPVNAPVYRYVTEVYCDLTLFKKTFSVEDYLPDLVLNHDSVRFARQYWAKNGLATEKVVVLFAGGGVNPAESNSIKLLPLSMSVDIVKFLQKKGCVVVLIGGPKDRDRVERLVQLTGKRMFNLCGKTSLMETAAIIEKAALLVSNDSSPAHIAVALGKPSLTFFGPTSGQSLLPANPQHKIIQSLAACSPCYTFKRFPGCSDSHCMHDIPVETILMELNFMLKKYVFFVHEHNNTQEDL